jgi:hypothetical protein
MWAIFYISASSGYHAEVHEVCYQKHTNPLNCRTCSSDISGYHADFHEVHSTVGKWQGAAWHDRGTAWSRHVVCELNLKGPTLKADDSPFSADDNNAENFTS